jgi:hypothetical protein
MVDPQQLVENRELRRQDISYWEDHGGLSAIEDLLKRHEGLPLVPDPHASSLGIQVLDTVAPDEQFQAALPVYDLAAKAGAWGSEVIPDVSGWVRVPHRPLDPSMFIAKVDGHSMEPGIPNGAWGIFRTFSDGYQPSPTAIDGRRVLVRLESKTDPETGAYTLKRWKIGKFGVGGEVLEVLLRPDNKVFKPLLVKADGDVRVVAEYLETVG